ncbi:MAG: hypothetical protein ACMUHY_02935 [Thermoplasmatota archaeon]
MNRSRKILPLLVTMALLTGAMAILLPAGTAAGDPPTRGTLYLHEENYNISFNKPTLYDSDDPYYTEDVEANTWDDVSIVVFFQDMNKFSKSAGSYTLTVAEMYQSVFVPLNGTQRSTGTTRTVLFEDITAAWCGPCTGVIGAMDRLNHDSSYFPDKYIGIEYHGSSSGDVYYRAASGTRATYYSIPGYPTVVIDGTDASVGGNSNANATTLDTQFKTRINTAANTASPLSIVAVGGHDDTKAWVNFTVKVEDSTFENIKVNANVVLVQDAHPRRHRANTDARLGWIVENMNIFRVFNLQGDPPVISNVLPAEDSVLSGSVDISFDATDPDASDDKIASTVEVRKVGAMDWTGIKKNNDKYTWHTAAKTGDDYIYPDGDYQIRITSKDFWDEESSHTINVKVMNPDIPTVSLNSQLIQDQFDDNAVEGVLNIHWLAQDDEDGSDVTIDLFYMRPGMEWTTIAEGLENTGVYAWDTSNPRIPDDDRYILNIKATDTDMMSAEAPSNFDFIINNPDPPTLEIIAPRQEQELSGKPTIRWSAEDDEDSQTKLSVEIFISEDGGANYSPLTPGPISNTGSYQFDSTYLADGTDYRVKIRVTDTTDLYVEVESDVFFIYNNDIPECRIMEPGEEDIVSGTLEIEWSSNDEEDEPEDMTYDLYYMFSGGTYWKELATNEPNTGSYELDTTELEEGDGVYSLRLIVRDSRGELASPSTVYFTVYNPDSPEIISAAGPTSTVSKAASFTWYAEDPDPAETDGLKIWFYYFDGTDWVTVAEGLPNTGSYTMDVSGMEDGTYSVKMVVADCQPGEFNMTAEHEFPAITVDNNDPPTVEITNAPDPNIEHEDSISFSWTASDPENNDLTFTAYYHLVGDSGWTMVPGAFKMTTTSFTWDISTLPAGDYELKIVALEDTRDSFEAEVITTSFRIKDKGEIIDDDDDDDDVTPIETDDESNLGLILGIVIALIVLLVIGLVAAGLVIMNRKKAAATQLPPPGGLPMQQAGPGLPGVEAGALPGAAQPPKQELPPAPAPQVPQQP